jgi:hypothetical protein
MKINRYFCHESGDQRTKARTFVRLNRLGSRLCASTSTISKYKPTVPYSNAYRTHKRTLGYTLCTMHHPDCSLSGAGAVYLDDIHGISDVIVEEPSYVGAKMDEMEMENSQSLPMRGKTRTSKRRLNFKRREWWESS